MTGKYLHRRLPKMSIANPEQREEAYDYFYKRPGVDQTRGIPDLPLHETGEPLSFFYSQAAPFKVRRKMGQTGPQQGVPKPTISRKTMINTKLVRTVSPIHRGRRKTYEKTDQRPISRGASPVSRWDGQVRSTEQKKDWRKAH